MNSVVPSRFSLSLTILLAILCCFDPSVEARGHTKTKRTSCKARSKTNPTSGNNAWTLKSQASGNDLIDFFNFETVNQGSQGGSALYVDLQEGYQASMIGVKNDIFYFGVDTTTYAENRKSFRISSKQVLSPGTLLVVDVLHMPATCGAWPSLWTVAKDGEWPQHGEIDIIEGVNMFTQNSISVHTKPGFWMNPTGFSSKFMMSGNQSTNCDATATNDQGCGLRDTNNATFGAPFNAAQGGVHVMEWTNEAINIYFFPRNSIPADISSGYPSKSPSWGEPRAKFQGSGGQMTSDYFQDHVVVFNTNLCGKWPEAVWNSSASYAGQSESCAAITGFSTCQEFITKAGNKLTEAYWAVNSIKVYN